MREEIHKKSVEFFETQFQRQVRDQEYALNPFETLALDYLFRRNELEEEFTGWSIVSSRYQTFPAPEGTSKEFSTVIA